MVRNGEEDGEEEKRKDVKKRRRGEKGQSHLSTIVVAQKEGEAGRGRKKVREGWRTFRVRRTEACNRYCQ